MIPQDFSFTQKAQLWVPINFDFSPEMKQRKAHFMRPLENKPGVTLAQAQADTDIIARRLEEQYPDTNTGWSLRLVSLREQLIGDTRPTLLLLFGAVGFVLLIACANVANLLLVRAATREREIALRTALGAGRFRIMGQMITESVLLSLVGGTLGALLAIWGVDLLVTLSGEAFHQPPRQVARRCRFTPSFSRPGVLFGLAPTSDHELNLVNRWKEGGEAGRMRAATGPLARWSFWKAPWCRLVNRAGLRQTFIQLQHTNTGLDSSNGLTMRVLCRTEILSPDKGELLPPSNSVVVCG